EQDAIKINSSVSLANATVKGGRVNTDFTPYRELAGVPNAEHNPAMARFSAGSAEQKQDPPFHAGLQTDDKDIQERQKEVDFQFIAANPESALSLDLLASHIDTESALEVIEPSFRKLSRRLRRSDKGKTIGEMLETMKRVD